MTDTHRLDLGRQMIAAFGAFTASTAAVPLEEFDSRYHALLHELCAEFADDTPESWRIRDEFFHNIPALRSGTIQRRAREKPLGYAGDYLTIDWMYTQMCSPEPEGKFWDCFCHRQAATASVRERKQIFIRTLASLPSSPKILNLGSGSCRDVLEAIQEVPHLRRGAVHCVDRDSQAIAYAEQLLSGEKDNVELVLQALDVFRVKPSSTYDLVWSAGLFDYLKDRVAVRLIARMWEWTADGGLLMFGNFHTRNPTYHYMEWCVRWHLLHRTEDDLMRLCREAGVPADCVFVQPDSSGTCIYCICRKS